MCLASSCGCLCPTHWSQVFSREWRCSWSSAGRRCFSYIWVINNQFRCLLMSYIRGLTIYYGIYCINPYGVVLHNQCLILRLSFPCMVIPMLKIRRLVRPYCLVHPGVRDKRWVSEIDLSQPRHETAFWWRHNGPVTSQLTDPIEWPNYPLELIGIYEHINIYNKESLTQRCRRPTNAQLCLIFMYISR